MTESVNDLQYSGPDQAFWITTSDHAWRLGLNDMAATQVLARGGSQGLALGPAQEAWIVDGNSLTRVQTDTLEGATFATLPPVDGRPLMVRDTAQYPWWVETLSNNAVFASFDAAGGLGGGAVRLGTRRRRRARAHGSGHHSHGVGRRVQLGPRHRVHQHRLRRVLGGVGGTHLDCGPAGA